MRLLFTLLIIMPVYIISCKGDKTAVEINLNDMKGFSHADLLSEYEYDAAVINYFATFCTPCRKELPLLEELHKEFSGRGVLITSFTPEDERMISAVSGLLASLEVTYPSYYNAPLSFNGDNISVLPVTFIIDRNGNLIKKLTGLFKIEDLREILETAISDKSAFDFVNKFESEYYNIEVYKSNEEFILKFKSEDGYSLGGKEYPPTEISVSSADSEIFSKKFGFNENGYTARFKKTDNEELTVSVKAFACSDNSCYIIDQSFKLREIF